MFYKIVTYGCQMNVHESEKIAGILEKIGYTEWKDNPPDITDQNINTNIKTSTKNAQNSAPDSDTNINISTKNAQGVAPDLIVFNTCCIRDTAESRAMGNIGVVKGEKKKNPNMIIAVVGCMTQQNGVAENIKERYPYVDIVLGTRNIASLESEIVKLVAAREIQRKNDKRYRAFDTELPENYLEIDETTPQTRTSFPNAWINIIYGCNNFCTYCIVPYVRGRELSRSPKSVLDEVKQCVENGYREITLLGQNVNSYGNDIADKNVNFASLLRAINKIDGKFRVRFMTSHPKDLNDDIIDALAECDKVCKNLHLPLQAGSDRVLSDMNRRYTREHYLEIIAKLRAKMPNIGITTDIMVGFPTETEEDFSATMRLIEEVRFSGAFTFIYSPRVGTPAAAMQQLPYAVKQDRIKRLIALQNKITNEQSKTYINKVFEVLAEDVAPKNSAMLCGRTDSGRLVTFEGNKENIGKFFDIEIDKARSASLFGKAVENTI